MKGICHKTINRNDRTTDFQFQLILFPSWKKTKFCTEV